MAERYIPEHRRTQFKAKNTFKPEELRRRREEQQVEIRKAKREENLAKRRGIGTGENRPGAALGAAPDSDDESAPTESQVWLPPSSLAVWFASLKILCIAYLLFLEPICSLLANNGPWQNTVSPLMWGLTCVLSEPHTSSSSCKQDKKYINNTYS